MLVIGTVVEFCLVVAQILLAWMLADGENLLCLLTQQPKISHVHRTRALALDGVVDNAHGGDVVTVDGCGGLWTSHLIKGKSHHFCLHCAEEEGAKLGFGGGSGNALEDG